MTNGEPAPKKVPKRRVPGVRSFAAGAVASVVAVFSVLAFRVHAGDDPAIASTRATSNTVTTTTTSSASSAPSSSDDDTGSDPYDYDDDSTATQGDGSTATQGDGSTSSQSSGSVSSTPQPSTSAS
jgi:hypothetical protein